MKKWANLYTRKDAKRMKKAKPEVRFIIVAFGDINAFGSWSRRIGNSPEQFTELMWPVYLIFEKMRARLGCFLKPTGDGFMLVVEMTEGHNCQKTIEILKCLTKMSHAIERTIRRLRYPRPEGFRVRVVSGVSWKWSPQTPNAPTVDYLGYSVNLCARLLEIEKSERLICHESIKELISSRQAKEHGIRFVQVGEQRRTPDGVDHEDMDALWRVRIEDRDEVDPKTFIRRRPKDRPILDTSDILKEEQK
jgi:hypothetical protein